MNRSFFLGLVLAAALGGIAGAAFVRGAGGGVALAGGRDDPAAAERRFTPERNLEHAFEAVAQAILPSVVSIEAVMTPAGESGGPWPWAGRMPEARSLGSGVIVSGDGHVLTNNHVVEGASSLSIRLSDGRAFAGQLVGRDPQTDLALVKVEAQDLKPARLGSSKGLRVGQWVVACGSPFGLESSVTAGIISATGRASLGIARYEDWIQTDASINQGNSGGPLVNLDGEVIGINTAIASRNGASQGVGFAIPSDMAGEIMNRLLADGAVVRGWLGVYLEEIERGAEGGRVLAVSQLAPGGPAQRAGLSAGDLILRVDGAAVGDLQNFRRQIARLRPGTFVDLELLRGGRPSQVRVPLGELPPVEGGR